jgi:adenine-specific DNA-methyltransferase
LQFASDQTPAKLRGGYYTPPAMADFLLGWGLGCDPARILEPSCGDGAFLDALARRAPHPAPRVEAVELAEDEAAKARRALDHYRNAGGDGAVLQADYLRHALEDDARYDLVLGNPPYVRYQYLGPNQIAAAQALLERWGLPLPRHASSWAPFVVDGASRLRPGGRLAMVVPAELLQVAYTAPLRAWLADQGLVRIVRFRTLVFPEVQQEVVLLLLVQGPSRGVRVVEVDDVAALAGLDADATACAAPEALPEGAKWTGYALEPGTLAAVQRAFEHPGVHSFDDLAEVCVGVVTGANRFFCVDEATVRAHTLGPVALPMFGRSAEASGLSFTAADHLANRAAGRRTWLLDLPSQPMAELPKPWQRYLATGEADGLPARYKCRVREPWWAVPSIHAAPVALFKRCHGITRLILNEAGAHTTDTVYRVTPRAGVDPHGLVQGFLNSLTMLSVELCGRSYGGGVLELIPSEIRRLRVPVVGAGDGAFDELDGLLRAGAEPEELLDAGDRWVLERGLGMEREQIVTLRHAWRQLMQRRLGRRG